MKREPIKATNVKVFSLHLPKTAGTSFENVLCQAYGRDSVWRCDYSPSDDCVLLNGERFQGSELPQNVRVLHGHVPMERLNEFVTLGSETRLITWLRDPIERVISNYYYWKEELAKELLAVDRSPGLLYKLTRGLSRVFGREVVVLENKGIDRKTTPLFERLICSFEEFIQRPEECNKMRYFVGRLDMDDFAFVGIMDRFEEDLVVVGEKLGWAGIRTPKKKPTENELKWRYRMAC